VTDRPDAAPPPDHADFLAVRALGFAGRRRALARRKRAPEITPGAMLPPDDYMTGQGTPACPTCGDAGQIPASGPGTKASLTMPCPDCTGGNRGD
jgi:hypothetical protein